MAPETCSGRQSYSELAGRASRLLDVGFGHVHMHGTSDSKSSEGREGAEDFRRGITTFVTLKIRPRLGLWIENNKSTMNFKQSPLDIGLDVSFTAIYGFTMVSRIFKSVYQYITSGRLHVLTH